MCYSSLQNTEAVVRRYFAKKVTLKVLQNSQENTCTGVSFLIKLQALCKLETCNFIKKEFPVHVFFCKFCEIFKSTYFVEILRTAAS